MILFDLFDKANQLRHLRKARFGAHQVDKRRRGSPKSGLWEYRVND